MERAHESVNMVQLPDDFFQNGQIPAEAKQMPGGGYEIPGVALMRYLRANGQTNQSITWDLVLAISTPVPYTQVRYFLFVAGYRDDLPLVESDEDFLARLAYDTNTSRLYFIIVRPTDPALSSIPVVINPSTGTRFAVIWDYLSRADDYPPLTESEREAAIDRVLREVPLLKKDDTRQYILDWEARKFTNIEEASQPNPLPLPPPPVTNQTSDGISAFLVGRRDIQLSQLGVDAADTVYYYAGSEDLTSSTYLSATVPLIFIGGVYYVYAAAPNPEELYELVAREPTREQPYIRTYLDGVYYRTYFDRESRALTISGYRDEARGAVLLPFGAPNATESANQTVTWSIRGLELDSNLFADAVMTDPTFSKYFQLNEPDRPYFLKNNLDFFFRWWGVRYRLTLVRRQSSGGSVEILTHEGVLRVGQTETETISDPSGIPLLTITAAGCPNAYLADTIQRVVTYFFYQFCLNKQPILIAEYGRLFPDFFKPRYLPRVLRTPEGGNVLQILKHTAPEIFVQDYARRCQTGRQPIPLDADDRESFRRDGRHFMRYPRIPVKGRPAIYLGCDDPKYKYIGTRENFDLMNKEDYREIPCCFTKPQLTNPRSRAARAGYTLYGEGQGEEPLAEVTETLIETGGEINRVDKVLDTGRIGKLPVDIVRALLAYGFADNQGTVVRKGILPSINSLIHCALYAKIGVTYFSDRTATAIEGIALSVRRYIAGQPVDLSTVIPAPLDQVIVISDPAALRASTHQELYDRTDAEIAAEFANVFRHFDSERLYRALEEMLGINVFVFSLRGAEPVLEIPRYAGGSHIRHPRPERPSIVVYKHPTGGDTEGIYELIIVRDIPERNIVSAGSPINRGLFDLFYSYYTTYTVQSSISLPVENFYSLIDLAGKLTSMGLQIIGYSDDLYGKARGYRVNIPSGIEMSIVCLPQQPLAVPINNELINAPLGEVERVFGSARRRDTRVGQLRGVWVEVGGTECYVPVIELPTAPEPESESELGFSNPLVPPVGPGAFASHIREEETVDVMLTVLTIIYRLYYRRQSGAVTNREQILQDFLARIVERPVSYQLGQLDLRRLAASNNYQEAVELVQPSGIMIGENVIVQDAESIRYYCTNYLFRQPNSFFVLPYRPALLDEVNVRELAFNTLVEFDLWVRTITGAVTVITNATDINPKGVLPYVFSHPQAGLFLVQNVLFGELRRALAVAKNWLRSERDRNTGYYTEPLTDLVGVTGYSVYIIATDGSLESKSQASTGYHILEFATPTPTYAALLPFQ